MLPAEKLPPELWLIIFELARESSTDPQQYCNYLTFPHLNLHLHRPSEYAFTIHVWPRTFRLICRYFNSLLRQSPPFFMKDADAAVPAVTRALYVLPQRDPGPQACLERLLADPPICNRITLLNLPGYEGPIQSPPTSFDFLCDHAQSLPAVRSLTLCVRIPGATAPTINRFWWRLNNAFPLLTTLVLRGRLSPYSYDEVVFEHLEVMDWDITELHATLNFPALRHASLSNVHSYKLQYLAKLPHLESLVYRSLNEGVRFKWSLFPSLRLLGLPAHRTIGFPPLPPYHTLQHLYVFVVTIPRDDHNAHLFSYEVGLTWLKETIELMPTITRLSLWFDKRRDNLLNWISGYFHEEDLELLGFTQRDVPCPDYENGYHIVLQRARMEPPPQR